MLTPKLIENCTQRKIKDSQSLYLYNNVNGEKIWRVRLRTQGKDTLITIGRYPNISIKAARKHRDKLLQEFTQDKPKTITLFHELITLYMEHQMPHHGGAIWEHRRIMYFQRLFRTPLEDLTPQHFLEFRDKRLQSVKPASVARELSLFASIFKYARQELRLDINPLIDVVVKNSKVVRDRRPTNQEIKMILDYCKYWGTTKPSTKRQQVAWAFLFAIETAMRVGEISNLTWDNVYESYVYLPTTKNGYARSVPLTERAYELIQHAKGLHPTRVLGITNHTVSALFPRIVRALKIEDLHFHDTRHEGTSRLAQYLSIQDLAKITGHRDTKMLLNYYNPTAEELAHRLRLAIGVKNKSF